MKRHLILTDDERAQITHRYKHDKNPRCRERLQCLLLKDRGHLAGKWVVFVYLPPYSPNLTLIERLWKFCKKYVMTLDGWNAIFDYFPARKRR